MRCALCIYMYMKYVWKRWGWVRVFKLLWLSWWCSQSTIYQKISTGHWHPCICVLGELSTPKPRALLGITSTPSYSSAPLAVAWLGESKHRLWSMARPGPFRFLRVDRRTGVRWRRRRLAALVSGVPATYVCLRVYRTYTWVWHECIEQKRERKPDKMSRNNAHSKALKIHYKFKCFGEVYMCYTLG